MGWFGKLKAKNFYLGNDSSPSNNRGTRITATGTEINRICDGITATAAEVNTACDGITSTYTELNKLDNSVVTTAMAPGATVTTTASVHSMTVLGVGSMVKTEIFVDMEGLTSAATANTIIGPANKKACHLGQVTAAVNGTVVAGELLCLETPTGGDDDVNIIYSTAATQEQGTTGGTVCVNAGDATIGAVDYFTTSPAANGYLYFQAGTGDKAAAYTAGKFLITLWGTV